MCSSCLSDIRIGLADQYDLYQTPIVGRLVEFTSGAQRSLARMDRPTAERILDKIELLASNPAALANNVKALQGSKGLKRLRVGNWRVVFSETLVILNIVRIGPRGSVYD